MTRSLGARHSEVRRLRALLRDPRTRGEQRAFVLEGPRVVDAALDRGAALEVAYVGPGATSAFAPLIARLEASGTRVAELREGVVEKVATTRTPQPVFAVTPGGVERLTALAGTGVAVVVTDMADPGNLGTIVRSAEAAGVDGIVVCGSSVDPFNPKVVRASAGAVVGVTVAHADDAVEALEGLRCGGRRLLGTAAHGGRPYEAVDLSGPCALVVGNEVRGVAPELGGRLDDVLTVPMQPPAESLNVAMATTVLLFEAARQRRLAGARP